MELIYRIKERLPDAVVPDGVLQNYLDTVSDRLCLRLGIDQLPSVFSSICVDAAVKMYRRTYFEGISSEGGDNLSTSFVEDILAEYNQEISDWKARQVNAGGSGRMVRFL